MKEDKLAGHSSLYKQKSNIYELFSQAEDPEGKITAFLKSRIVGKIVLDFGCGTGKFISEIASFACNVIGVDVNESQLQIARSKIKGIKNVELLVSSKDTVPLSDRSIDVIFAAWVLGGIHDLNIRSKILEEFERILKPGGLVYLIENDKGGDYKEITGGDVVNKRTEEKIEWFKKKGYIEIEKIRTSILFKDIEEAKKVFEVVWGEDAMKRIKSNNISVNLVVLSFKK